MFKFKNCIPQDVVSRVFYKYMYGRCMSSDYRTTDILELDSKEDIDISKLTMRKMKPVTKSSRPCFTMSLFSTNFAFSDMQIKKVFN